jgi:phosphate uptake regulator
MNQTNSVEEVTNNEDRISSERKAQRGETRKVQLTGGSTLVVSLPREWARSVRIKPQDEIYLIPQSDMSLLLTANRSNEKPSESTITITSTETDDEILRKFIAYYIAGFDTVRFQLKMHSPEVRSRLKGHIRDKLIGVEIVEETNELIVAQCLRGHVDLPLKKALNRMAILTSAMQFDSINSLCAGDLELAKEIIERDDEVDRFAHFIARQLNLAVHDRMLIQEIGLSKAQDCLNYRLIVKSIERIADHAAQIASSALMLDKRKISQPLIERIHKLSKLSNETYANALRAVDTINGKIANETIGKLNAVYKEEESATEELISSKLDNRAIISLRLALESLRRTAEYSSDICEIVVNMIVGSPF